MERVKVYSDAGYPVDSASGKYAETIMRLLPELPVEEEGRLMDSRLRENFIERVFIYHRWQQLVDKGVLDPSYERTMYTTFLASSFRSIRFGIGEATNYSLEEIGCRFALTRERIRQIEIKALRKLRAVNRRAELEPFLKAG